MGSVKGGAPKSSRCLMYVQQTDYLLKNGFADRDAIKRHLEKTYPDAEWAFILHDKDKNKDGTPAKNHIHISFYFDNARSPVSIAKDMLEPPGKSGKVEGNSVTVFTGKTAKQSLFSYLIHATPKAIAEGKHRYDVSSVTANFDYAAFVNRSTMTAKSKSLDIEDIEAKIIRGDVILADFYRDGSMGTAEEMGLFFAKNSTRIERAIAARYKIQMKRKEVGNLEIIYFQGDSGSGKTALATEYAMRKYGDYFKSGSSNDSAQDYMGEPVAIFDDARPTDFSASDWLKMLDPYNNKSSVRSRFYNKYLAVKCIILTSIVPFEEFFVEAKGQGSTKEPVDQFMRRFSLVVEVEREDHPDETMTAHGKVFDVVRCPQYTSTKFLDENEQPLVMNYRLEEVPNATIHLDIDTRQKTNKAKDLLEFFED